jgi:hypothetical protein
MTDPTAVKKPKKRPPGRPRGHPRSGGRARGTPNRDRAFTVARIEREADPIGLLIKITRGDRMTAGPEPGAKKKAWWYPSADQRVQAATVLARKILPDQRAVETSGPQGEPIVVRINLGPSA